MMEFLLGLVHTYGYLGVFLASLIGSAGVFIPLPSFVIVIAAGSVLNPLLVGIAAGSGAALGELVGYGIGLGLLYGKRRLQRRKGKESALDKMLPDWLTEKRVRKWFSQRKGPLIIFIFAATPLPDKIIGVVCGLTKYDIKKFFLATLTGKILLHVVLAYAGFYSISFLTGFFM